MAALLEGLEGNPLAVIVFTAVVAIIFAVQRLGLLQGEKAAKTGTSGEGGRILGAVIDSKKADEIIAAIDRLCDLLEHQIRDAEIERRARELVERERRK